MTLSSNRYTAVLLTFTLLAAFVIGLFIQPTESRANLRTGWIAEYYDNPTFSGEPSFVTSDETIDMNWSTSAPYQTLPSDFFSVRWTSQATFEGGIYRFRVGADDGIRLTIDGNILIDAFEPGPFRSITRDVQIPEGEHIVEVDYYEATGTAGILVDWTVAQNPTEFVSLETLAVETVANPTFTPQAHIARAQSVIYSAPSAVSPRLTQVAFAQVFPFVRWSEDKLWAALQLPDGRIGWAWGAGLYFSDLETR